MRQNRTHFIFKVVNSSFCSGNEIGTENLSGIKTLLIITEIWYRGSFIHPLKSLVS